MRGIVLVASVLIVSSVTMASAQGLALWTDKFGYNLTVTKYATLSDAQSRTNSVGGPWTAQVATPTGASDGAAWFSFGHPSDSTDRSVFLTAWYYTTADNTNGKPKDDPAGDRYYSGWGNPSNTNTGFIQLYDDDASTVTSVYGGWTSLAYDTFVLNVKGKNAIYGGTSSDWARLWPAPLQGGAGNLSPGEFHEYEFYMMASGLVGVPDPLYPGYVSANGHPAAVSGYFRGIFQNKGVDPYYNGFYVFEAVFVNDNWAFAQGDEALNGDFSGSYFSAPAIPEPVFFQMGALMGLSGLGLLRLRRKA